MSFLAIANGPHNQITYPIEKAESFRSSIHDLLDAKVSKRLVIKKIITQLNHNMQLKDFTN